MAKRTVHSNGFRAYLSDIGYQIEGNKVILYRKGRNAVREFSRLKTSYFDISYGYRGCGCCWGYKLTPKTIPLKRFEVEEKMKEI